MTAGARVDSIAQLQDFRSALLVFAAEAGRALEAVNGDLTRTSRWLDEQSQLWGAEVRRCEEEVFLARQELDRQRIVRQVGGRVPDCPEQEKALRLARLRLEEAQDKLTMTRKWLRNYDQELLDYQAPLRQLQAALEGDIPRASALLENKISDLEAYLSVPSSSSDQKTSIKQAPGQDSESERSQP